MNNNIESVFTEIGGVFLSDTEQITLKLKGIKAFVFEVYYCSRDVKS